MRKLSFSAGRVVEDIKIKRKEEGLINLPAATDGCALFFFAPLFFSFWVSLCGPFLFCFVLFDLFCIVPFLHIPCVHFYDYLGTVVEMRQEQKEKER